MTNSDEIETEQYAVVPGDLLCKECGLINAVARKFDDYESALQFAYNASCGRYVTDPRSFEGGIGVCWTLCGIVKLGAKPELTLLYKGGIYNRIEVKEENN